MRRVVFSQKYLGEYYLIRNNKPGDFYETITGFLAQSNSKVLFSM